MSEFPSFKKSALPFLLVGSLALNACGDTQSKSEAKSQSASPPHASEKKPGVHLPPNPSDVVLDEYTQGKRVVTFKTQYPRLLLQVIELCDGDTLVDQTQMITVTAKGRYREDSILHARNDNFACHNGQMTPEALNLIPQPAPLRHRLHHPRGLHPVELT